ncbi:hypothetical protein LY76DRAFT_590563 [Colletotrichum caudatum]|nr:hypothetical protein LY76DRAFT_590563 [Colletotrichum caudatum]
MTLRTDVEIGRGCGGLDVNDLADDAEVQTLINSDMVDFFNTYIKPGSNELAKVSVHLVSPLSSPISETATEGVSVQSIRSTMRAEEADESLYFFRIPFLEPDGPV